jgi:sulfopropanediol 3-dehydrogenase
VAVSDVEALVGHRDSAQIRPDMIGAGDVSSSMHAYEQLAR